MSMELTKIDAMCMEIDALHTIPEVKLLRDKVLALVKLFKQQNNEEAAARAAEARIRAERKIGELTNKMANVPGPGRGKKNPAGPDSFTKYKSLEASGISTQEASEWERLADIPQAEFEATLADPKGPRSAKGIVKKVGVSQNKPTSTPSPKASTKLSKVTGTLRRLEDGKMWTSLKEALVNLTSLPAAPEVVGLMRRHHKRIETVDARLGKAEKWLKEFSDAWNV